jgi:alkylation response protein AidB-like acyl-CoA dehydrogenase
VFEELAGACPSTAAFLAIHNMATWMITAFARPEIVAAWGPPDERRKLASYCLTEPNAGSDAASLRTRARRDGDTTSSTAARPSSPARAPPTCWS